jgi:hypothetical protein
MIKRHGKIGGKLTSYVIGALRNLRKREKLTIGWARYFEMANEMMKKTDPNAKE